MERDADREGGEEPPADQGEPLLLVPGQRVLQHYRVVRYLGRGGMGAVYHLRHEALEEERALKVLLPQWLSSEDAQRRFRTDARAAQRLLHEGVVRVFEFGELDPGASDSAYYLVMELVAGQDLQRWFRQRRSSKADLPSVDWVAALGGDLLRTLEYAHRTMIHGDIKPANLLLVSEDPPRVKLVDFGLASVKETALRARVGERVGISGFMAPEQVRGDQTIDARADIYSVAAVLYYLLTGKLPLGRFKLPGMLRNEVPPSLDQLLERALAQSPEERFPTAAAMRGELERLSRDPVRRWDGRDLAVRARLALAGDWFDEAAELAAAAHKLDPEQPGIEELLAEIERRRPAGRPSPRRHAVKLFERGQVLPEQQGLVAGNLPGKDAAALHAHTSRLDEIEQGLARGHGERQHGVQWVLEQAEAGIEMVDPARAEKPAGLVSAMKLDDEPARGLRQERARPRDERGLRKPAGKRGPGLPEDGPPGRERVAPTVTRRTLLSGGAGILLILLLIWPLWGGRLGGLAPQPTQTPTTMPTPQGAISTAAPTRAPTRTRTPSPTPTPTTPRTLIPMVRVPAGSFAMGSLADEPCRARNEAPRHRVRISPFLLGRSEVTRGQFAAFIRRTGYRTTAETVASAITYEGGRWEDRKGRSWRNPGFRQTDAHPVVCVSWYDAVAFCNWLSEEEGLQPCYSGKGDDIRCDFSASGYRLRTEAEWEYACRAGTTGLYNMGDNLEGCDSEDTSRALDRAGWYWMNAGRKTHPVAAKSANAWGLYDTHGNVWEWCWDRYGDEYYSSSPPANPKGPALGSFRVLRGGGWNRAAGFCRSAYRGRGRPGVRKSSIGFRIARSVSQDGSRAWGY